MASRRLKLLNRFSAQNASVSQKQLFLRSNGGADRVLAPRRGNACGCPSKTDRKTEQLDGRLCSIGKILAGIARSKKRKAVTVDLAKDKRHDGLKPRPRVVEIN